LKVGKVATAASDAALKETGSGAVSLHLGVVVGFQRNAIKIAEAVEEVRRHVAKVGGVADAIAEAVDYEAVRTKAVMSEGDRVASEPVNRRENFHLKWSDEWHEFGGAESEGTDLVGVTTDRDI
jgi:hypothetical protein